MKCKLLAVIVVLCLVFGVAGMAHAGAFGDVQGHWAQTQIVKWAGKGLAGGYPDGTFRPDGQVTRAEFVAFVNRAFGKSVPGAVAAFADVKTTDWFHAEVATAVAAGYISGYEDNTFRPNQAITRQEAAAIVSRFEGLQAGSGQLAFSDAGAVAPWARSAVLKVVTNKIMGGYPDGTFKPGNKITRAEAVVTLDRALGKVAVATTFDKAGVYGPETGLQTIAGNVVINASGITLRNTLITGDLLLGAGIGDGSVKLQNVTVRGTTVVRGGGPQTIEMENCTFARVEVDSVTGNVRILATGNTQIKVMTLESGCTVVAVLGPNGQIETTQVVAAGAAVTLEGTFTTVEVTAPNVNLNVAEGSTVSNLTVGAGATGAAVNLSAGAAVTNLTLNAAANVTGQGTIVNATINASGSTIEQQPTNTTVAPGVTATVGGETVTGPAAPPPPGPGPGPGPTPSVEVTNVAFLGTPVSQAVGGNTATIDLTGLADNTMITAIQITATAGSSMVLTKVSSPNTGDITLTRAVNLPNVTVNDLLGGLAVGGDVSMGALRSLFGEWVQITGTLSKPGYTSRVLTLTVTLGAGGTPVNTEWATLTYAGNIITATIKTAELGTSLVGMDLYGLLMGSVGKVPARVRANGTWYDPVGQLADLKTAIAPGLTGKAWGASTLSDLVGKTMYFTETVGGTVYTINFVN